MANSKITFKLSKDEAGRTVRTHAETGLRVVTTKTDRGTEYVFYAPVQSGREIEGYWGEAHTLSEMKWMAEGRIAELRQDLELAREEAAAYLAADIEATAAECGPLNSEVPRQTLSAARRSVEADHAEAIEEDLSHARKQFPSVFAMIENAPAGSAHGAPDLRDEANPVEGYDKAETIRDAIPAVYRTGDVLTEIADALRHAERARDLHAERARDLAAERAPRPETDAKRVMMGMLATACGFPEVMRAWATRHGMSQDGYTIEGLIAAYDADHAEALRRNAHGVNCPAAYGVGTCTRTADCA